MFSRNRVAAAVLCISLPVAAGGDVRLILLGTAGGPTPKQARAAPAQALVVGDDVYVVDCGNGVARQLVLAGLPLGRLRHVFVTHHHSDHVADLVTLPVLAWADGHPGPIVLHGPRPIGRAVRAGLRQFAFDLETRRADEGRKPFGASLRVHEFADEGIVHRDERVAVRAMRVTHPPIRESYAYRFDVGGSSFVFSGDTAPAQSLVHLARGADVLVHEVWIAGAEETARLLGLPVDDPVIRHIARSHTSVRDVGRVAASAGVGKLVLTHFVPGDAPFDEAALLEEIRRSFQGPVIFGHDLLEIR